VPSLTADVFPDRKAAAGTGWSTAIGTLPYPLRGDAADLPAFDIAGAADQKDLRASLESYQRAGRTRGELEERRLAYVAVTRARELLLCSGYWWDDSVAPRGPSDFLTEVASVQSAEVGPWVARPDADDLNPGARDRSQCRLAVRSAGRSPHRRRRRSRSRRSRVCR